MTAEQIIDGYVADVVTLLLPPGMPWGTVEATLRAAAPGA